MKKILVVEDDAFIRDISTIKLNTHGYDVVPTKDGYSAQQALQNSDFDAVLLDIDLPDISGIQILKEMRESERHKKTPVIVFSNRDDEAQKSEVLTFNVAGYFVKASTEYDEVFECIDSL